MKVAGSANLPSAKSSMTKTVDKFEKQIEALMKQKSQIMDTIASVKSNEKLSNEQKNQRVELLSTQLQSVETQIMQKKVEQAESQKEKQNEASDTKSGKDEKNSDKTSDRQPVSSIGTLLSTEAQLDNLELMRTSRRKLKVQAEDLKSEVKKNRHLLSGGPPHFSRDEMRMNAEITVNQSKLEDSQSIEERALHLDLRIGEGISSLHRTAITTGATVIGTGSVSQPEGKEKNKDEEESNQSHNIDILV